MNEKVNILSPKDIPFEVAKELERLHTIINTMPDKFEWASNRIDMIHQVIFNPPIIVKSEFDIDKTPL